MSADPILAAISAVRLAEVAHTQALDGLDEDDEAAVCRADEACDRHSKAAKALATLHPQSWEGFRDLIHHYAYETDFYECGGSALKHLARIVERSGSEDGCPIYLKLSAPRPYVADVVSAHRAAWDAFQIAPHEDVDIDAAYEAQGDMQAALDQVLITPCANRAEALALRFHLRWWLAEEAELAADYQPKYAIAEARVAELDMLLNGGMP